MGLAISLPVKVPRGRHGAKLGVSLVRHGIFAAPPSQLHQVHCAGQIKQPGPASVSTQAIQMPRYLQVAIEDRRREPRSAVKRIRFPRSAPGTLA